MIIGATRRVAKNTGVLLAGNIISKLCILAFFAIAARYIGPEGFGKYTFALSFTSMLIILGDLGLNTLAIREVARDRSLASKYLGNIAILKTILSAIAVGIIFLVITLLNYPSDTTRIVYILGISVFIGSLSGGLRWCFQAFQKMEYEALMNTAQGIILLGLGLAILYLGKGLIGLAFAHLLTSIIIFCFSFLITLKKFGKPRFEMKWNFWKFLIRTAIPIGLATVFVTAYYNIDTVMLSLMKGDAPVGWYNAGYKLVNPITLLLGMFSLALFPVMSDFYKTSIESFKKIYRKSVNFSLMVGLPIALGTTILSYKIIPTIFGQEFFQAIPALQILIWAGIFAFISGIIGTCLIAIDKQKINTYICLAGLITNIILNLALIPKFSYIGAAIAILIAQFLIISLMLFLTFKTLKMNFFSKPIFKALLACFLMGLLTWFIKDLNIAVVTFLSAIFYLTVLWCVKGITRSDLKLIRQMIKI